MEEQTPRYFITTSGPHELGWIYTYQGEDKYKILLVDEFSTNTRHQPFLKTDVREIEPAEYKIMEVVLSESIDGELENVIHEFLYKKYDIKKGKQWKSSLFKHPLK